MCVGLDRGRKSLEKKTRPSALRFTKLSTVMVMDSFGSAGLPSKEKSLYEFLIGKHTCNSFASPSPSSAPFNTVELG